MEKYEHLRLPIVAGDINSKPKRGGGGYALPSGRNKANFAQQAIQNVDGIKNSFATLKNKFSGKINPNLIFEIKINQSVSPDGLEGELARMGIHVLSVAENKKGYWIVFADDTELRNFKNKLDTYGKPSGAGYDFFNAIESFQDIPSDKKIGKALQYKPLDETADFIDVELWKMVDPQQNEQFIFELEQKYTDRTKFKIFDRLITKTFVLLRIKLTKNVFDEIIEFKEIARADRPAITQFNPFEYYSPDIDNIEINSPDENAVGILIIDSGIISNHPMLEKCVGGEENFQTGENATQDTVGHGTAVAGCAAYGDIESCLKNKEFIPSNWIFSAKVMYAEKNDFNGIVSAVYDPEKLIEHQFKDAVESFLSNPDYHIRVVNISLGNSNEIWHKNYSRQLPLAALIDELAFTFPDVVFIVSAGNQHPLAIFETITDIKDNYPAYLTENQDFKIINPATAALALTIGSIAGEVRIERERYGAEQIKTPIAEENQPSPFTRTGNGINGMIKPELVEYGGNLILYENHGNIPEDGDRGGRVVLLHNKAIGDIIKLDYGTSFSAPKVAHLAGKIANKFPQRSGLFIKNMLLMGASYPFVPSKDFYSTKDKKEAETKHLSICGFGLSDFDRAVNSFSNRTVLWDENKIGLDQIKVYSLQLPDIFFTEKGKKRIIVTLTFNPETRLSRGDSYLGNRMEFHLFHSVNPETLIEKYGVISENTEQSGGVPDDLKKFEINFFPLATTRKAGCHQKAWKEYKNEPKNRPASPVSLVLLNSNRWITALNRMQDYCISVTFEHEKEIELYNQIKLTNQVRIRV
ncbi:MAG: S8 family peptidase [Methylococcales bacterium]|nr:S8 family peptidase [Methylococcales bacterium]MDP3839628.1 S8 family peptidase [Methylococcales bacterium]